VLSYFAKDQQAHWKHQLQSAWALSDGQKAHSELEALAKTLEKENRSAANSLREGLEETLTLHRLKMTEFSRSFTTCPY
jgi:putative transposase